MESVRAVDGLAEDAFDRTARLALRLLNGAGALICVVGDGGQTLKYRAVQAALGERGWERAVGSKLCAEAVVSGRPIVIADMHDHPAHADPAVAGSDVRACLGAPLLLGEQPIGALWVVDVRPRSWDQEERRSLERLAVSLMNEIRLQLYIAERNRLYEQAAAAAVAERRRSRQLRDLARASVQINAAPSLEQALQAVTDHARELVGAHQSLTSFTTDPVRNYAMSALSLSDRYAAWRHVKVPAQGEGIFLLVCQNNRAMRMTQEELEAHPAWRGFGSYAGKHLPMRGWLAVPLIASDGQNLGVIQLSDKEDGGEFTADDEAVLTQLAQLASASIERAANLENQYEIARTLQRNLLPRSLPKQSAVEFASRYLPAASRAGVGGDWFDVIGLSGGRVALVVGDVVGHGIHASAAMGRLRTAIRTLADVDPTPDELLTRLDDMVIQMSAESGADAPDQTASAPSAISRAGLDTVDAGHDVEANVGATCLYAVYDPVSGRCSMARAGHPPPFFVAPDGTAAFLDLPAGPPLGLGGLPFESVDVELPEGSLLALYTDGLVESRKRDLDVGLETLRSVLTEPVDSLERLCDRTVQALLPDPPADDAALLLVRSHTLDDERVASWTVPADPAAVAGIRTEAVRTLVAWGLEELEFVTELVVSELVTNAIRYGSPPIQLRLIYDRTLICEVSDSNSTAPHLRRARTFDENGRGLLLIAQLTQRWGTRQTTTGKTIWCEQALPATSELSPKAHAA
ncbi:SpoIIE family protein phosphatase [Streptomyces sp. NPDC002514]|uniref:SpoIIE family protein phosphatase n=1 Tax=Streptomyces sp. NPDC001270 TaxID=3364554 RepID=UPI00368B1CF4